MIVNGSKKLLKVAPNFCCEICDYTTCKKSSYIKHLATDKHEKMTNDSKNIENDSEKLLKVAKYTCQCGKNYSYDSGYYRHKKYATFNHQLIHITNNLLIFKINSMNLFLNSLKIIRK